MKPHFYNLRSRLGMINAPYRQKSLNIGVEEGGDAILTPEFLQTFPGAPVDEYDFSKPEDINKKTYYEILAKELKEAEDLILKTIQKDEVPIVVGGDNSVSFSALNASLRPYKETRIGYIRIDSHPDMNSLSSSPSGNFHGMWMRPFVDSFEEKKITKLVKKKLSPFQLLYIGNLDIDPGEQKFFTGQTQVFSSDYLKANTESVTMNVEQFMNNYKHIFLGIDIDGFDGSIAPATGIPAESGVFLEDLQPVLDVVKNNLICVDLVEVNPQKKGAKQTVELAQKILLGLLE